MREGLLELETVPVNRSELRQKQKAVLKRAKGRTVVVIEASDQEDEKVVLDKAYFDEVIRRMRSLLETLEITTDERLFPRIMALADTLEGDVRRGRLHSIEDAFRER